MKKAKQINILQELKKQEDYEKVNSLLKKQNFKDFAEEMDFINQLPRKYQRILLG